MKQNTTALPLAYGYVKEGELYYKLNFPELAQVTLHGRVGAGLFDFMWLPKEIFTDILEAIYLRYIALHRMGADADAMMDDLLQYTQPLITKNMYLNVLMAHAIVLLTTGRNDERIAPPNLMEIAGINEQVLLRPDTDGEKRCVLLTMPDAMVLCQQTLKERVARIFEDERTTSPLPMAQRLYCLSRDAENPMKFEFTTSLQSTFDLRDADDGTIKAALLQGGEVLEMAELQDLFALWDYELLQAALHGAPAKRCKCCGEYFIPKGRVDSEYCGRIMPSEERPCSEIGALRLRAQKDKEDPIRRAYKQAYRRMDSQKRCGSITPRQFNEWNFEAMTKRDACAAGEMELQAFVEWLNGTRKRNSNAD